MPHFFMNYGLKKSNISLEPTWQKANHLSTTFRYMETESCNLNFIFSNADAHNSQWQAYYMFVPVILFHAVEVVEALLARFAKRKCHDYDIMPLRTVAGMMLYFQETPWESNMKDSNINLSKLLENLSLPCPKCGEFFKFDDENLSLFYHQGSVSCNNGCGELSLHV
jgi:hypothetical protein